MKQWDDCDLVAVHICLQRVTQDVLPRAAPAAKPNKRTSFADTRLYCGQCCGRFIRQAFLIGCSNATFPDMVLWDELTEIARIAMLTNIIQVITEFSFIQQILMMRLRCSGIHCQFLDKEVAATYKLDSCSCSQSLQQRFGLAPKLDFSEQAGQRSPLNDHFQERGPPKLATLIVTVDMPD